jgi:glutamate 5-kinase
MEGKHMPAAAARRRIVEQARSIVVKIGTNAICDDAGRIDAKVMRSLAGQIADVQASGKSVTLVTSAAIQAGVTELALPGRPKTLPKLQAAAAVGQVQLMRNFHDVFARRGVKVAQVLVTRADFEHRTRYLNIRNTLVALSEAGVLAIINENDTVAVDEIRFGDNDVIAALVTNMLAADLAVFLSNVDGVLKDGAVVDVVEGPATGAMPLAGASTSRFGSGGMASKIEAARMVTKTGEVAVIANSRRAKVLTDLLAGEAVGTVFAPAARRMSRRLRWIGQASRPAGKIVIDEGAVAALTKRGRSLLPSGISAVIGRFDKGAVVAVVDRSGRPVARGLTNYSSRQLDEIKGVRSTQIARIIGEKPYDEVIHRNNMVVE